MRIHLRCPSLPKSEDVSSEHTNDTAAAGPPSSVDATSSKSDPYTVDFDLTAFPEATIADLKNKINTQLPFSLPPEKQRLIFLGRFLRDNDTLKSLFGNVHFFLLVHASVHV